LGEDFDIELSETHHRHKVDAPSGTCLMLAETAAKARGVELKKVARFERYGHTGSRPKGEIGFSVRRGGQSPGEHTISFLSDDESIELTHHSFSRSLFVKGALKAARWVVNQPAGLYTMSDVLSVRG
jgi:4-hydroxy-tetrahydrodipicolinate reductase